MRAAGAQGQGVLCWPRARLGPLGLTRCPFLQGAHLAPQLDIFACRGCAWHCAGH